MNGLKDFFDAQSNDLQKKHQELSLFYGSTEVHIEREAILVNARNYMVLLLQTDRLIGYVETSLNSINFNTKDLNDSIWDDTISTMDGLLSRILTMCTIKKGLTNVNVDHLKQMISDRLENISHIFEARCKELLRYLLEKIEWPQHRFREQSLTITEPLHRILKFIFVSQGLLYTHKSESSWIVDVFSEPLAVRYRYNFRGKEKTNNIYKPEWQFVYINKLMLDQSTFFEYINDIIQDLNVSFNIKHEVMKNIITEVKTKILFDINVIMKKSSNDSDILSMDESTMDSLLFHTISEIIDFERDLEITYGYPSSQSYPRPMDIFFDETSLYEKWISLELFYSRSFFKEALHSPDAWSRYLESTLPLEDDPYRIPNHVVTLFNYLSIQRERCCNLGRHRFIKLLKFFEGQKTLISDYFGELYYMLDTYVGIVDIESFAQLCKIINSTEYCRSTLKEWDNNDFYLDLLLYENDNQISTKSPFYEQLNELKDLKKALIGKLVFLSTESFSKAYRKYINGKIKNNSHSVSQKIIDCVYNLWRGVNLIEETLNKKSFHQYSIKLALKVDETIAHRLESKTHMSKESFEQIEFDLNYIIEQFKGVSIEEKFFKQTFKQLKLLKGRVA